jgi:hypothetical protein
MSEHKSNEVVVTDFCWAHFFVQGFDAIALHAFGKDCDRPLSDSLAQ